MDTYCIKVALRDISPMIWRRLRVAGNTSLADLHYIIQIAMGWDDEHLHCFHIYGEDYGISYEGGLCFNNDARKVFLGDFGFDTGDRFTYTYNFTTHWLCDVRVERIEQASKRVPNCFNGSGRLSEDGPRYYKPDVFFAMMEVLEKVVSANETTVVGELRPLIEHYESVRFSQRSVNQRLKTLFNG